MLSDPFNSNGRYNSENRATNKSHRVREGRHCELFLSAEKDITSEKHYHNANAKNDDIPKVKEILGAICKAHGGNFNCAMDRVKSNGSENSPLIG